MTVYAEGESMDVSWKSFAEPDPESDLLGVVGEIRPVRYRTIPRVLRATRGIESQLADSEGLVGYTLRARILRRRFWAVSVWEGEESLREFVANEPHVDTMTSLKDALETSQFHRFDVRGEDVPVGIDDAIARAR